MKREHHNARWKERFAEDPKAPAASVGVMQQMAHRLKTRRGKKLYALRKQNSRAGLRDHQIGDGLSPFLLRGFENAKGEWNLVTMS